DHFIGFSQIRGQWFFDQDIDTRFEKLSCHSVMIPSWHSDAGATNSAEKFMVVGKRRSPERLANCPGALAVDIDEPYQICLFPQPIFLRVKFAQISHTDNGDG